MSDEKTELIVGKTLQEMDAALMTDRERLLGHFKDVQRHVGRIGQETLDGMQEILDKTSSGEGDGTVDGFWRLMCALVVMDIGNLKNRFEKLEKIAKLEEGE